VLSYVGYTTVRQELELTQRFLHEGFNYSDFSPGIIPSWRLYGPFPLPEVIIGAGEELVPVTLKVSAKGLKKGSLVIGAKK